MLQHGSDFGIEVRVLVMEYGRGNENAGACSAQAMCRELESGGMDWDGIRVQGFSRGTGRPRPPVTIGSSHDADSLRMRCGEGLGRATARPGSALCGTTAVLR